MAVCPFISNSDAIMQCHPACAMRIDDECAIAVVAQSILTQKEDQRNEQSSAERNV